MAARQQSNVFWLSYKPGQAESVVDFAKFLKTVLPEKAGALGSEVVRDGESRMEMIVCLQTRIRVSSLLWRDKWARMGARGTLQDAKWPRDGEAPYSFLRRWADAMTKRAVQFESGTRLFDVWENYRDTERGRLRKYQRSGTRPHKRGRKPSPDTGVSTVATPTVPSTTSETIVQVDDAKTTLDWSPHEFVDFDQGLALPCWYPLVRIFLARIFVSTLSIFVDEPVRLTCGVQRSSLPRITPRSTLP